MQLFSHFNNIPITMMSEENLALYESGQIQLILANDYLRSARLILTNCAGIPGEFDADEGVFIHADFIADGLPVAYPKIRMEDLLIDIYKSKVWVLRYGQLMMLPYLPWHYYVGKGAPTENHVQVNVVGEKRLVDLLKNSIGYGYSEETGCYEKLTNEERKHNMYRYIRKHELFKFTGDVEQRCNDLSRLVLFLFQKIEGGLTAEERVTFEPLLTTLEGADSLDRTLVRLKKAQAIDDKFKVKIKAR